MSRNPSLSAEDIERLSDAVAHVLSNEANRELLYYRWSGLKKLLHGKRNDVVTPIFDAVEEGWSSLPRYPSHAQQMHDFRREFSRRFPELSTADQEEALRWVCKAWGGIHALRAATLRNYLEQVTDNNTDLSTWKLNVSGLASFSKCMAFVYPEDFFIYDSRVAMALNRIFERRLAKKTRLSVPDGRSFEFVREKKRVGNKSTVNPPYTDYCRLIQAVAKKLPNRPAPEFVEMQLFMMGGDLDLIDYR